MQYGRQSYAKGGFGAGIMGEFKNAFKLPDNGLMQLIFINVASFVGILIIEVPLVLFGFEDLFNSIVRGLMLPGSFLEFLKQPWSLISYFFLHSREYGARDGIGFMHILFNMYGLYIFGKIIKEFLGGSKVVSLYVLGGLSGGLVYLLIYNLLPNTSNFIGPMMLGASAGVYAVVIGSAVLMPDYTLHLMFFGPVRIKYLALGFMLLAYVGLIGQNAGGDLAHLGGAALGFIFIKQLQSGTDLGKPVHWFLTFMKSFFIRQPKVHVSYKKTTSEKASGKKKTTASKTDSAAGSEVSQEEIDAILDKISQYGYESLSKDEKQKLFSAGK